MEEIYKDLDTPALLIEKSIMEKNIRNMQALANASGIRLRPHVKTHKSPLIAKMQLDAGAKGICCAKLSEAEIMADSGIKDIIIANIITGNIKIDRLIDLSEKMDYLAVCVDSKFNAEELSLAFGSQNSRLKVYIEIDTGLGRCGLKNYDDIYSLCRFINEKDGLELEGILTHAGHAYAAKSGEEVEYIGLSEGRIMVDLAERLRQDGIEIKAVSVGSTPTAGFSSTIEGVTELRTGVYIYNDMMQVSLGSAKIEDCALTVLATVISVPAHDRAVIDAGSKALSLDKGAHGNEKLTGHGKILNKNAIIARLSEEHGIITHQGEKFQVGERLRVIPNHACAVVNLFDFAYLVDNGKVLEKIQIEARGKIT